MNRRLAAFILLLLISSCEEVIDVDTPSTTPKLVVEADLLWFKESEGQEQTILLSRSTDYFDETDKPVTDAAVKVRNIRTDQSVTFVHTQQGKYQTDQFKPILGDRYQLIIETDEERFIAEEELIPLSPIQEIEQTTAIDFAGEEVVSIDALVNDRPGEENFYHVIHDVNNEPRPYISIWDDEFQDGNTLRIIYREYFTDEEEGELLPNDEVEITISGISEEYANFMTLLLEQFYAGGDPFSTVPAKVRGNVVNQTNPSEQALGYFRLSEAEKRVFTVSD